MNLTTVDFKFLVDLEKNCREPLSSLIKKTKLSKQLASYKLKNYIESGLILSFNAFIDYVRFGYLNFRVYFKINYLSEEKFRTLLKTLMEHDSIAGLIECGGKYDLIAIFAALSPSEFNKRLKELIAKNPAQLKNYVILTTVVTHYYSRTYFSQINKDALDLFRDNTGFDTIIGGDRSFLTIDKKDNMILELLQSNARLSSVSLATKLKSDPKTVRLRIRALENRTIIKGFRPIFNVQKVGFIVNKILLKYHNLSVEKEQELMTFCKYNPNIVELIKIFGEWDLELTVETRTREEFQKVYISIREKFEDIIQDFESFPVFETHKKEFLPASMFNE